MNTSTTTPTCVGFILDGNRRWAREKGVPTLQGHKKGSEVLEESIDWVYDAGIPHMVCYAFSTENWKRSTDEVAYLMKLFHEGIKKLDKAINDKDIRLLFIGQRERFSQKLQDEMNRIEAKEVPDPKLTVRVALSYGGRAEIVDAVNRAIIKGEQVEEETFGESLWTADMPDPDLIIRTSGEKRLSNFLPWQSVYSELFFTDTYWPDFSKEEFSAMLEEYAGRKRRKGK